MSAPSKLARSFQREAGASQAARGFIGDPLKLPFARILQEVQRVRLSEAYRRLVQAGAAALTLGQQEETYLDAVRGLDDHDLSVLVRAFQQLVLDMDDRPYVDLLGPLYMEIGHKLDKQGGGEFFTPHALSRLLAQLEVGSGARAMFPPDRPLDGNEPTCGTGGMILAFTEVLAEQGISALHTRWVAQDLSPRSCWGTYINLTLWGVPATVICGDTLRLEQRWVWQNLYWRRARPLPTAEEIQAEAEDESRFQRIVTAMRMFLGGAA